MAASQRIIGKRRAVDEVAANDKAADAGQGEGVDHEVARCQAPPPSERMVATPNPASFSPLSQTKRSSRMW
jgi:hypothetical protein